MCLVFCYLHLMDWSPWKVSLKSNCTSLCSVKLLRHNETWSVRSVLASIYLMVSLSQSRCCFKQRWPAPLVSLMEKLSFVPCAVVMETLTVKKFRPSWKRSMWFRPVFCWARALRMWCTVTWRTQCGRSVTNAQRYNSDVLFSDSGKLTTCHFL